MRKNSDYWYVILAGVATFVSAGALSDIITWAKTKTPCASNYECLLADLIGLEAALAAHDQKVRAEVREQRITLEQVRNLPRAERPISVVIGFHDGHIVKAAGEGALEFYRAMLDGRKRAEEEK